MLGKIDLKDIAVLIDFDGTITTKDTNTKLIDYYGDREKTNRIRQDFKAGKLTFPQYFQSEIYGIKLNEEEYINFLLEKIEISPGFLDFYKEVKEKEIKIGIVSGGFVNGIVPFLKEYGIEDIDIFANTLAFDGDKPHIKFLDGMDTMCCDKGPCGNCKIKHYNRYKKEYDKVIFIGDGITDMPVAEEADMVFAKDSLAEYLDQKKIDYIGYENFEDINKILFK